MSTTTKKGFDLSRDSVYVADPNELRIIGGLAMVREDERGPLDTAHVKGEHDLFDERILTVEVTDAEVANIDTYGVNVPIAIAKDEDGEPVVVDGRGRVRRARRANILRAKRGEPLIKIKCVVVRSTGTRLMATMIALNEVRNEDGPLVKLEKAKRLLERGVSNEDAAVAFGLEPAYFDALLAYDDAATPEVKASVASGEMSATAAVNLVSQAKTPSAQNAALANARAKSGGKPITARAAIAGAKVATGDASADMLPTRRELGRVLKAITEYVDGTNGEAAKMLNDEKSKITPDRTHVVDSFYLGAQAAIAMMFGKCKDADLLQMLADARKGAAS